MRRPRAGAARRSTVARHQHASLPPPLHTPHSYFLSLHCAIEDNYDTLFCEITTMFPCQGVPGVHAAPRGGAGPCEFSVTTLSSINGKYIVLCHVKRLHVRLQGVLGATRLTTTAHLHNLSVLLTALPPSYFVWHSFHLPHLSFIMGGCYSSLTLVFPQRCHHP